MKTTDIVWLAGLLEGEGCFRNGNSIQIQCSMIDKDVVRRAANLMSAKVICTPGQREGYKAQWRLYICGKRAAAWMMTLYPLMGERRKAKIRECLEKWRGQALFFSDRKLCANGHNDWKHVVINGRARRICRQCKRDDSKRRYHKKKAA